MSGTCRDEEACENFRAEGVDAHLLDSDNEQTLRCGMRWCLLPDSDGPSVPCLIARLYHTWNSALQSRCQAGAGVVLPHREHRAACGRL